MTSPVFYFNAADRIWIKGAAYRTVHRLQAGYLVLPENLSGIRFYSDEELGELFLAGQLCIERQPVRPGVPLSLGDQLVDRHCMSQLQQRDRAHLNHREMYCRRFLEMERAGDATRSDASMRRALAIIHAEMKEAAWRATGRSRKAPYTAGQIVAQPCPPSVRTLRRALKSLEHSGYLRMATAARTTRRAK